ncbi:MAG: hypothetical protein PUP92_39215 [Rhizonema sp. PD38]|nr:hypothetical protein [Rhizonema sp. PD38]
MSLTFREAKTQLSATSVSELRFILEQANRPTTEPVSTEDFDFLRSVYPLIKEGVAVVEAIATYTPVEFETVAQDLNDDETPPQSFEEFFNTFRQQFIANAVESALTEDAKTFYTLYLKNWESMLESPQVINDPEVKEAQKSAMDASVRFIMQQSQVSRQDFLTGFSTRLQKKILPASVHAKLLSPVVED